MKDKKWRAGFPLTVQSILRLVDLFVCFGYTVIDFLLDRRLKTIKSLLGVLEVCSVTLAHRIDFAFEFLTQNAQLVLKLGPEGLQRVIDSLGLSFCEVAIGLNFALDVLEFGLELLFRLDALHEHDIVVSVHLDQLVVHGGQWHILILLANIACHIFLDQLVLGCWHFGFHQCVASGDQR